MKVKSIKVLKNKIINNNKGSIIKYVSKKNKFFSSFGEVYFSILKKNKTKGWNYHKKYTCIITVPLGEVEFMIINKKKKLSNYKISKKKILIIPPNHWFAFKSNSNDAIIVNLIDGTHSNKERLKSNLVNNIKIT